MNNYLIKKTNYDCYKLILNFIYPTKKQIENWLFIHKYNSSCIFMKKFNLIKKCNCYICDLQYYGYIYNNYYKSIFKKISYFTIMEKSEDTFFNYLKYTKCLI